VGNRERAAALQVVLDGRQVDSETICMWAGSHVLVITTTLPETEVAFEVTSTFVRHQGVTDERRRPVPHD
jgi:hypothetical protein